MRDKSRKIPRATPSRWRWAWGLLKALANIRGTNGIRVVLRPNVGIDVILDRASFRSIAGDEFAVVRLTEADGTNAWQYKAEEVIGTDPMANPPTYAIKDPGRTFGINPDDEGMVVHPLQIEGLETTSSGADPVYVVRRFVVDGSDPQWVIVGAAGGSLPEPGALYQVLQLQGDPDLVPVWDYVRAHE